MNVQRKLELMRELHQSLTDAPFSIANTVLYSAAQRLGFVLMYERGKWEVYKRRYGRPVGKPLLCLRELDEMVAPIC